MSEVQSFLKNRIGGQHFNVNDTQQILSGSSKKRKFINILILNQLAILKNFVLLGVGSPFLKRSEVDKRLLYTHLFSISEHEI